ncbi:hypothetical protein ABWH96_14525 [Marivirga tractuosa]|uniref:hypothetical protein n=1 Tax=Marivirga tractuosa TaxID=1006 RepID=UPI0035CFBA02
MNKINYPIKIGLSLIVLFSSLACQPEEELNKKPTYISEEYLKGEKIVLGKKLENPYSIEI